VLVIVLLQDDEQEDTTGGVNSLDLAYTGDDRQMARVSLLAGQGLYSLPCLITVCQTEAIGVHPSDDDALGYGSGSSRLTTDASGQIVGHFPEWDSVPDKYLASTTKSYLAFFKVRVSL